MRRNRRRAGRADVPRQRDPRVRERQRRRLTGLPRRDCSHEELAEDGGTRLVASLALGAAPATAQTTAKPNILVIWGDDIGTWNISHNNRGMMGYKTPNIDRIAKEGVAFTDYYGQQSCTAGRAAFIGGTVPAPQRHDQGGHARRGGRLAEDRRHHGHGHEEPGLRHGPVRQEPPGRPRRTPAHHARLRRVPRQSVPPERGRGTGEPGLPEGPGVPQAVRPTRCAQRARPTARAGRPAKTPVR